FETSDGVRLRLRRCTVKGDRERKPVLVLHGASAASNTFEVPERESLVDFLLQTTRFEPWLLDWRGSRIVTETHLARAKDALAKRSALQTLEEAERAPTEELSRASEVFNEVRRVANQERDV